MKKSSMFYAVLLVMIAILAVCNLAFPKNEEIAIFEEPQPPRPTYAMYGTGIDITPFISDIENVNGIDCTCIIYEGQIIYVP